MVREGPLGLPGHMSGTGIVDAGSVESELANHDMSLVPHGKTPAEFHSKDLPDASQLQLSICHLL